MTLTQRTRGFLFTLFSLSLLLVAQAGAASVPKAPEVLMNEVSQRMLDTLKRDRDVVRERPQHMFDLVDQVLGPHVDFPRMSGWILGKYWRQATPVQRERFIAAFRVMMVRFYTAALLEDPKQLDDLLTRTEGLITFQPSRPAEGDTTTVRSEVHMDDGKVVLVLFSVHNRDGDWKVFDVTVEGVSLVANYRTSFAQEIVQVGIDGLITRLEDRNKALMEKVVNGNGAVH